MGTHRRGEITGESRALRILQNYRLLKTLLGLATIGGDRCPQSKELLFRVAHERDEDATLAPTTAAKPSHHFFEFLSEILGLPLELGRPAIALRSDMRDKFEAFFCALYSVVASVTR
jgi:hypothetical protein